MSVSSVFKQRLASLIAILLSGLGGCQSHTVYTTSEMHEVLVGVEAIQNSVALSEPVSVRYSLENNSADSYTFLPWGTPLEKPITADCFDVFLDDRRIPYTGSMVKRAAPVQSDYLTLERGETMERVFDLSRYYDMATPGTYVVQLKMTDGVYNIGPEPLQLTTSPVEIVRLPE